MQKTVFRVSKRAHGKRRIGVQAACGACRSRKLACDGKRPRCSRCQTRGEPECSYETERAEETRMQAMRRELDRMRTQLDQVGQTLTALRDLPPDGAARLIADVLNDPNPTASLIEVGLKIQTQSSNLTRQISMLSSMHATFPNTKSAVQFELYLYFPKWYPPLATGTVQPPSTKPVPVDLYEWQAARSRLLLASNSSPSDDQQSPGFRISSWDVWVSDTCIKFWTRLPISIGLAERAVNAYMRSDHVLFVFMDTELFLRDLIRCENRYCSMSLVNAVLHYGCTKIARCDPEAAVAVTLLEKETQRTLREDSNIGVTKAAALNIHYVAMVFWRPFEQAKPFLDEALAVCDEIYGWSEPAPQFKAWCKSAEDERALAQVVWSVCSSFIYQFHRWGTRIPPPIPRLPIPFLDASTRGTITLPESHKPDLDKIASERYILAAISANLPFVYESLVLRQTWDSLSDEDRASQTASIYRRALQNAIGIPRPRTLHAELIEIAAISQMWSHFWILGLFQPLVHYRGAIPGFQASGGTAAAIFAASASQMQHLVFLYQRFHILAPPTASWHGPIFVAAVALTQLRQVSDREQKFEALLWLFADLAVSFPGLRQLMQSLALTGYGAGLVDLHRIRMLFHCFADMCKDDRQDSGLSDKHMPGVDARRTSEIAMVLREKSYDAHFATPRAVDLPEEEEGPAI